MPTRCDKTRRAHTHTHPHSPNMRSGNTDQHVRSYPAYQESRLGEKLESNSMPAACDPLNPKAVKLCKIERWSLQVLSPSSTSLSRSLQSKLFTSGFSVWLRCHKLLPPVAHHRMVLGGLHGTGQTSRACPAQTPERQASTGGSWHEVRRSL